jgi:hypothetical protein
VGNAQYERLPELACCRNDVLAFAELIRSTGRYDEIRALQDASADDIRSNVRDLLSAGGEIGEFLFYFSGHGFKRDTEFYFCAKTFDPVRPNETGLSHDELSSMMRSGNPELAVKIIDACSSGSPLIKGDVDLIPIEKGGFRNVIQIASCLENQSSLTGEPLSEFTEAFCLAALRKEEGPIYYSDVINSLRDEYIDNESRAPHFVSQGTGRELFIENISDIMEFKSAFLDRWIPGVEDGEPDDAGVGVSFVDKLIKSEEKYPTPERAEKLVQTLFDGVSASLMKGEMSELFTTDIVEHSDYREPTARSFIIRALSKESRPDHFVTATTSPTQNRDSPWRAALAGIAAYGVVNEADWELKLNCAMKRAQLRITLTPKFTALQMIKLVVTVAPSLNKCYVFEIATQHERTDWNSFDIQGREVIRNWYEQSWSGEVDWLIDGIRDRVLTATRDHIEKIAGNINE